MLDQQIFMALMLILMTTDVVPFLIKKFCSGLDEVEIPDGSPVRDFIYSYDVAK